MSELADVRAVEAPSYCAPSRWADGLACALRRCSRAIAREDEAVVAATERRAASSAAAARARRTAIAWAEPRVALHAACWDEVASDPSALSREEAGFVERAQETLERFDALRDVEAAAAVAAGLLLTAQRVVAFTGAGLSVAAGIPDYRGTGGLDTRAELGYDEGDGARGSVDAAADDDDDEEEEEEEDPDAQYTRLTPTLSHRILVGMRAGGLLTHVVTQNCDNLHARAGTPREEPCELHGNVFVERCERCGREAVRDYCVDAYSTDCYAEPWFRRCRFCKHGHYTGRACEARGCGGALKDTIVNFGDPLPLLACGGLRRATAACAAAGAVLVLGSSLTVRPACLLPLLAPQLVVVNLQATDLDAHAAVRVHASCDTFMALLWRQLQQQQRQGQGQPAAARPAPAALACVPARLRASARRELEAAMQYSAKSLREQEGGAAATTAPEAPTRATPSGRKRQRAPAS